MFPVLAPELSTRILKEIIPIYLADNTRARQLGADGVFHRLAPGAGETPVRCQMQMLEQATPEAESFAAAVPPATGGEGLLLPGLGRLTAPSRAGRGRGPTGKSRKSRG